MVDIPQIIDEIRSFLQSDDQTFREELRVLATGYRESCIAADRRLKQCNRLLAQGLRAEALHEADGEPKLLELLTLLDFPERQDWEDIVATYGLDAAPRIDPGLASALIEAYAEADPLSDLLRQHRLLALSRAGLARRIAVLGQIAELDPNNGIWEEDLRSYEKARQREIASEAEAALRQRDAATLARLCVELRDTPWRELPPVTLVQSVTAAERKARRETARDELVRIGATLHDAYSALDVGRARAARQQWEQQARIAKLDAQNPILTGAKPALDWLEDRDASERTEAEYRRAVAELEAALDDAVERDELERLGAAVLRFERGMSELLERRYRARLRELELNATRKRSLIFGVATVSVVALGALGIFLAIQASRVREVAAAAATLAGLINQGQLPEAQKFWDTLQANQTTVAQSSQLQGLAAKLRIKQGEEQERKQKFEASLETAQEAPLGPEEPAALVRARSLAQTDEEKSRVLRMTESRKRLHERQVAQVDEQLAGKVEVLTNLVRELERVVSNPDEADPKLDETRKAVEALSADAQAASKRLQGLVAALRSRVTKASESILDRKLQVASEKRMADVLRADEELSVSDLGRYVAEVKSFVKSFPQSPRSKEFDAVLAQEPLWKAAVEWSTLARNWRSRGQASPTTPNAAQRMAGELEVHLKAHAAGPDVERARRLSEVAARPVKRAEVKQDLISYLQSPIMTLWVLEHRGISYHVQADGELRRIQQQVMEIKRGPGVNAIQSQFLITPRPEMRYFVSRQLSSPREFRPSPRNDDLSRLKPSPQATLGEAVVARLQQPAVLDEWERPLVAQLEEIRQNFKIDPILKVEMLHRVLELAGKGDLILEEEARDTLKGLKDNLHEDVAWMDPQDFKAQNAREDVRKALDRVGSFTGLPERTGRVRADLDRELAIIREPIGWLCREDAGWTVRVASVPNRLQGATLQVVESGGEGRSPQWVKIGRLEGKEPIIERNTFVGPAEGRPVFASSGEPVAK
jgi:hypothetical protein